MVGMILTGQNISTQRMTYVSGTLSTTNSAWNDLGVTPGPLP